ncbi:glutathione S-transferase family protein [Thalassococcus sp. CAU 1522]|uniref:Glutathione S-transferase family protein n=1 Tax=Thalassococcus arenae TaxID=2851652 RepID=A0ABS6N2J2_9RHOB|nr:glutathione S-transferase family protein [Thalassococcus arenae]MBV2358244.1 glutathione S-transferase family protein [Thalassococcus arenae]
MTTYRLHYAPDNASFIIRWVLEEQGPGYETRLVDRRAGAQRSAAHLALNPAGRIPVLETPQGPISETAAILLWLDEAHGGLLPPRGTAARARMLNTLLFVANTLHPEAIQTFYLHRYGPADAQDGMRAALQARLRGHLAMLDALTAAHPPDGFDAVQPYLAAILRWLALYPPGKTAWFALADYPALHGMAAALETRPALIRAAAAEGLGAHPFTAPEPPDPPEGSAV